MSKILFLGDLYYDYNIIEKDMQKIIDFIKKNNYKCILNLEAPLCAIDEPCLKVGPNLVQSKITIDLLKKLNVIGVTLANNHMYDYGKKSLEKTIELLGKNGIKYCGAGKDLVSASIPMEFEEEGLTIFNYGWNIEGTKYAKNNQYGCAPRKEKNILNNLKKYSNNNFCIHLMHWGFEYSIYPQPMDVDLAHKLIDSGSDLIIGHHPHIIQACEFYKKVPIYYSLGNFYFSSRRDRFNKYRYLDKPTDRCNYGLGLIFNVDTKKIEDRVVFYYNPEIKQTEIFISEIPDVVPVIDKEIVESKKYVKMIKENRQNPNPIYTVNKFKNWLNDIRLELFQSWCLLGIRYRKFDELKKKIKSIVRK